MFKPRFVNLITLSKFYLNWTEFGPKIRLSRICLPLVNEERMAQVTVCGILNQGLGPKKIPLKVSLSYMVALLFPVRIWASNSNSVRDFHFKKLVESWTHPTENHGSGLISTPLFPGPNCIYSVGLSHVTSLT